MKYYELVTENEVILEKVPYAQLKVQSTLFANNRNAIENWLSDMMEGKFNRDSHLIDNFLVPGSLMSTMVGDLYTVTIECKGLTTYVTVEKSKVTNRNVSKIKFIKEA